MIRVCIGACPTGRHERAVRVLKHSIQANSSADIEFIVGGNGTGATGFSSWRYNIPIEDGYAIYMDCDVLVYGDVAELMEYKQAGMFVGAPSKLKQSKTVTEGTMPGVLDCSVDYPDDFTLTNQAGLYVNKIPSNWNHCDFIADDTKLMHLSRQKLQPWYDHAPKDREVDRIWLEYEASI